MQRNTQRVTRNTQSAKIRTNTPAGHTDNITHAKQIQHVVTQTPTKHVQKTKQHCISVVSLPRNNWHATSSIRNIRHICHICKICHICRKTKPATHNTQTMFTSVRKLVRYVVLGASEALPQVGQGQSLHIHVSSCQAAVPNCIASTNHMFKAALSPLPIWFAHSQT